MTTMAWLHVVEGLASRLITVAIDQEIHFAHRRLTLLPNEQPTRHRSSEDDR